MSLTTTQQRFLIEAAWESIRYGMTHGAPLHHIESAPEGLDAPGASFVTLEQAGQLRGCIGSLEAHRPLIEDVAHNAFHAAFADPRFPPLQADELAGLSLQVSVLSPPEPLHCRDEADCLRQLRPGVDGVIIQEGHHRATFLPQVWEQLPSPTQFMAHLKHKAGLPDEHWSPSLRVQRYQVEKFS